MNWALVFVLWFFPTVFLHELGHYAMFRFYKIKPEIKLKWWGIQIGNIKDMFRVTPYQFFIVAHSGIVFGFVYTFFFKNTIYTLLYILMSSMDILILYYCIKFKMDNKKKYGDYAIQTMREEIRKFIKARQEVEHGKLQRTKEEQTIG